LEGFRPPDSNELESITSNNNNNHKIKKRRKKKEREMNGTKVVSVCWKTFALPTMTNYSIASNNNNNHKKKKREERKKNERDNFARFRVV
jgi:hypothetical protein